MTVLELIIALQELGDTAADLQVRFFYFSGDRNCTEPVETISTDIANDGSTFIELSGR